MVSPFFVLDRETGRCLWEKPESAERCAMLHPRALSEGVIVAEKCEVDGRSVTFRGVVRIDAATGALLPSGSSGPASPRGGLAAATARLRARHVQRYILDSDQLLDARDGAITMRSGEVIDVRSGAIVGKASVVADAVPAWTTPPITDANASVIILPGIGELLPGHLHKSDETTGAAERFWQSWPHAFHLRSGGKTVWAYDDPESKQAGLTGSLTYDKLRPPYAYILLYKIEQHSSDVRRDAIFDLTLRVMDLRTGEVVGTIAITDGPLHKWPSIADVDNRGLLLVYREADTKRSTVVSVATNQSPEVRQDVNHQKH